MGLFHKKKKDAPDPEPASQERQLDIRALFGENLKYISRTEADPDLIEAQFVKSQSRFFLTVGTVDCPTGEIVVSDPLCYLATGKMCPRLSVHIQPGAYPVEISLFRNPTVGIRICTARLKIKKTKAVSYSCAEPTEDSAVGRGADGLITGFPVEAGMMSFCDAQVAEEYQAFLERWHRENPRKNHYDDYFARFFAESEKQYPAYQREGGDFIEWANPDSGRRMVMAASGFGDGFYQSYWGSDSEGDICELIVPLVNPDLFE